jgi:hypothetical protein
MKTQLQRVLDVLRDGPATTRDVADETGLPMKHCSAYLGALVKAEQARVKQWLRIEGCRPVMLVELVDAT